MMDKLGFPTLDHPKKVERLAVLDVIPIVEAWNRWDARFAQTYWPWILLSQKQPRPESYLLGAPEAVFHSPSGQGSVGPDILAEYVFTYRDRVRVHGICEEYRAARRPSMSNMIARTRNVPGESNAQCCICGPRVVRSTRSTQETAGPSGTWQQWAPHAHGQAMKGGHFFPEENANDTAALIRQFIAA